MRSSAPVEQSFKEMITENKNTHFEVGVPWICKAL